MYMYVNIYINLYIILLLVQPNCIASGRPGSPVTTTTPRGLFGTAPFEALATLAQTPGRVPKVDPPWSSKIYTTGVLEPTMRGSILFRILLGVWEGGWKPFGIGGWGIYYAF